MEQIKLNKQDTIVKLIALGLMVVLVGIIHIFAPEFFPKIWSLATTGDMEQTINFLRSYGAWAIVVSFLLDVLINAVGFLPSIFLSTANGLLFGITVGVLVSWLAESVGVIISFLLMRFLFRSSAEALIQKSNSLERLNDMSGEKGLQVMALARTMPYFPSGILTALGAVSKMSIKDYVIATFIGKFPSTALEVIVGHDVVNYESNMQRLTIFVILIAVVYGFVLWREKNKNKKNL